MTTAAPGDAPLLEVRDLRVAFSAGGRDVVAVDGVDVTVHAGETVALVGESGSGKSVTALSIMRLLPAGTSRLLGGSIRLRGRELTTVSDEEMRAVRGRHIGMVFQEPMTSLNPVHTVGAQVAEVVECHDGLPRARALAHAVDMLALVGIPDPQRRAASYPHQLSGGMRQRVMIAMALACRPSLLIADEPTTALDVTIQAQILDLLADLQARLGMALLFISHDLGVVAEIADCVVVMYAGQVVESAAVGPLFTTPRMPYTAGLLASMPRLGRPTPGGRLPTIPGQVPAPSRLPPGCRFANRCAWTQPACDAAVPTLEDAASGHQVRCRRWRDLQLAMEAGA
jgi:peptide/nickel transport system ATP-binding protein/oligopeptide transport system ATP-binding protein